MYNYHYEIVGSFFKKYGRCPEDPTVLGWPFELWQCPHGWLTHVPSEPLLSITLHCFLAVGLKTEKNLHS
jgi:hypothetical protein